MKKNKDIDLTKLIGVNLIKYVLIAIILSIVLDFFIVRGYSLYLTNKVVFDDLNLDLENYQTISEEFLLEHNSGIEVVNDDLKVIYSKGFANPIDYKYRPSEFTNLVSDDNLEISIERLTKTYNNEEINIILKQQYTKSSLSKFLRISFLAFLLILIGTILVFIITFALLLRAIYKPIKTNLDFIRDHIAKTPYDKTKADLSKVYLKEVRAVMWSYNHMLDEMEEIRKDKDETIKQSNRLVSNLSHDLKSPITTLKGYSELLMNDDISEDEKKSYVEYINNSANDLSKLVDLLFEQVKFQYSDYKLNLETADLNNFLKETTASYYPLFENKGFNLKVNISDNKFITEFDKVNMKRVFSNLFDNIINHNPKPTDIEVTSKDIGDYLLIEVKDNGIGIDLKNKEDIFEPFYQIDKSRTNGHSGLGLFLVKQILNKHNGKIILTSDGDYKTIFKIYISK